MSGEMALLELVRCLTARRAVGKSKRRLQNDTLGLKGAGTTRFIVTMLMVLNGSGGEGTLEERWRRTERDPKCAGLIERFVTETSVHSTEAVVESVVGRHPGSCKSKGTCEWEGHSYGVMRALPEPLVADIASRLPPSTDPYIIVRVEGHGATPIAVFTALTMFTERIADLDRRLVTRNVRVRYASPAEEAAHGLPPHSVLMAAPARMLMLACKVFATTRVWRWRLGPRVVACSSSSARNIAIDIFYRGGSLARAPHTVRVESLGQRSELDQHLCEVADFSFDALLVGLSLLRRLGILLHPFRPPRLAPLDAPPAYYPLLPRLLALFGIWDAPECHDACSHSLASMFFDSYAALHNIGGAFRGGPYARMGGGIFTFLTLFILPGLGRVMEPQPLRELLVDAAAQPWFARNAEFGALQDLRVPGEDDVEFVPLTREQAQGVFFLCAQEGASSACARRRAMLAMRVDEASVPPEDMLAADRAEGPTTSTERRTGSRRRRARDVCPSGRFQWLRRDANPRLPRGPTAALEVTTFAAFVAWCYDLSKYSTVRYMRRRPAEALRGDLMRRLHTIPAMDPLPRFEDSCADRAPAIDGASDMDSGDNSDDDLAETMFDIVPIVSRVSCGKCASRARPMKKVEEWVAWWTRHLTSGPRFSVSARDVDRMFVQSTRTTFWPTYVPPDKSPLGSMRLAAVPVALGQKRPHEE